MINLRIRRWLRRRGLLNAAGGTLIAVVVMFIAGARGRDDPEPVEVGGLRVVLGGTPRISMEPSAELGAVLSLKNADGIPELIFAVRPSGEKAIVFGDTKNRSMIGINLLPDGNAVIGLGFRGGSHIGLAAQNDGAAWLQIRDKNDKVRIKLGLQPDGSPGLEFFDEQGKRTHFEPTPRADEKPGAQKAGGKGD
jgi:hypothetical protein